MKDTAKEKNKTKDYYHIVVTVQIILVMMLLGLLVFFSKMSGDLKSDYENFKKWEISENVYSVVISMKDYFQGDSAWSVNSGAVTVNSETETTEDQTEKNTTTESEPETELTENEPTTSESAEEITKQTEPLAIGGEDISLYEAAENTSFAPIKCTTKLSNPIEKPRYTSYFGYRINPITDKWAFHTGLDIAAPNGTKIRAALSGTVTKIGEDSRAGKYIFLTHSDGFVTFYCHCSEIVATLGANIRQGETIAKVGSTGYSTGPHLHFEVRKDNIRYNPLYLLEDDS